MPNSLSLWLGSPAASDDPDKVKGARIVLGIVGAIVGFLVVAAFVPLYPGDLARRLTLAGLYGVVGLATIGAMRWCGLRTAAIVLTAGLWLTIAYASITGHGVRGEGFTANVVVIMLASYLIGSNAGLGVLALCSVSGLVMAFMETSGRWSAGDVEPSPMQAWLLNSLVFGACWVTVRLTSTTIGEALRRARSELDVRRRTEAALRRERALSSRIVETSPVGIAMFDRAGRIVAANTYAEHLLGLVASDDPDLAYRIPDRRVTDLAGEPLGDEESPFQRVVRSGLPSFGLQQLLTWPDGRRTAISVNAAPLWAEDGLFDGMVAAFEDITERSRAAQALQESEERFRRLAEATSEGIGVSDPDRLIDANRVLAQMFGFENESEIIGRSISEFVMPETAEPGPGPARPVGDTSAHRMARRRDGTLFPVEIRTRTIPHNGRLVRVLAIRDVTDRQRTDDLLVTIATGVASQTGESFFRSLVEHLASGLEVDVALVAQLVDGNTRVRTIACYVDGAAAENFEYALEGTPCATVLDKAMLVYPSGVQGLFPHDADLVRLGVDAYAGVPLLHGDGSPAGLMVVMHRRPFRSVQQLGSILKIFAVRAAAELERTHTEAQRQSLEERLRQAQKMETVGQLAGGVAHDFNNLLSPILGYAEMVLEGLHVDDPRYRQLNFIREAAEKAAALTRQLLSFSRKQVLEMKALDLNRVVSDFQRILRRTIREDIEIVVSLDAKDAVIEGDVSQVEQIIMNLAVNAQDALPTGGRIRMATRDAMVGDAGAEPPDGVEPGRYVVLELTDNGIGMDAETVLRIFEPFFTTKEKGRGTGLGLATVYGIANQHRGGITVASAPGKGTSFHVYFPSRGAPAVSAIPEPIRLNERGSETLIVVEDDPMVRALTCTILRQRGYVVLEMTGPHACLEHVARHGCAAQLLVTDVVMPGMNGKQLYERLAREFPGLKVVYISGYAHDVIVNHGVGPDPAEIVQKPFTADGLAGRVRELLDS
jgi:PAS domain S-box-containing protein